MAFSSSNSALKLFNTDWIARSEAERARQKAIDALPPLERNAAVIAELEQEWAHLGPLREITYTVLLREGDHADALVRDVISNGFTVKITRWGPSETYRFTIEASRTMLPEAAEVTRWQAWFEKQISSVPSFDDEEGSERPGAEYGGWSYPRKLTPTFWDEKPRHAAESYRRASAQRTRILFGDSLCEFEASNGWADGEGAKRAGAFHLVPRDFIENARRRRPKEPEPTASGFAQWLYSLYTAISGNDEDRERGLRVEEAILAQRRRAFSGIDHQTMRDRFPGWRLKHNGMNIDRDQRPPYITKTSREALAFRRGRDRDRFLPPACAGRGHSRG